MNVAQTLAPMSDFFAHREWFAAATIGFFVAFAFALRTALRSRSCVGGRSRVAPDWIFAVLAWLVLGFALFRRGAETGALPLTNSFEIFETLGWLAVFSVIFLRSVWSLRIPAIFGTGAAALLCALGFIFAGMPPSDAISPSSAAADVASGGPETFASADSSNSGAAFFNDSFSESSPGPSAAGTPWIGAHTAFATVGYACFSAAAMIWLIYLLQNFALRKRRMHRFFARLPDLASLDRVGGRLCAAGLVIFGAGAALGSVVLLSGGRLDSALAAYKVAISVVIFFGFLTALILRRKNKISAAKFPVFGLVIFVFALLSLGGMHAAAKISQNETASAGASSASVRQEKIPSNSDFVPAKIVPAANVSVEIVPANENSHSSTDSEFVPGNANSTNSAQKNVVPAENDSSESSAGSVAAGADAEALQ